MSSLTYFWVFHRCCIIVWMGTLSFLLLLLLVHSSLWVSPCILTRPTRNGIHYRVIAAIRNHKINVTNSSSCCAVVAVAETTAMVRLKRIQTAAQQPRRTPPVDNDVSLDRWLSSLRWTPEARDDGRTRLPCRLVGRIVWIGGRNDTATTTIQPQPINWINRMHCIYWFSSSLIASLGNLTFILLEEGRKDF